MLDKLPSHLPAYVTYLAVVAFGLTDGSINIMGESHPQTKMVISAQLLTLSIMAFLFMCVHLQRWRLMQDQWWLGACILLFLLNLVIAILAAVEVSGTYNNGISYTILVFAALCFCLWLYKLWKRGQGLLSITLGPLLEVAVGPDEEPLLGSVGSMKARAPAPRYAAAPVAASSRRHY